MHQLFNIAEKMMSWWSRETTSVCCSSSRGHIYDFILELFSLPAPLSRKKKCYKNNTKKYYVNIRHPIYFKKRNVNYPHNYHFLPSSQIIEHKNCAWISFTHFAYTTSFNYCNHVIKEILAFSQF